MKMLVTPKSIGIITYLRVFIEYLIWGYHFKKDITDDCCHICGKPLKKRRFEVSIDRPEWGYVSEYDKFLCVDHAIQTLLKYRMEGK